MRCPKCQSDFEAVTYENVEVDRCIGCGGIWFDALEKEDIERFKNAGSIDVGDKRVGNKYNAMWNVNCPKCEGGWLTKPNSMSYLKVVPRVLAPSSMLGSLRT